MDDIAAQLSQILSDPAQMAQISQLASSLGLGQQEAQPSPDPPPQAAPSMGDFGFDMDVLGKILPLLQQSGGKEAQIFQALRPYLSPADQQRVDKALRAARLSRLTKMALKELGDGKLGGLL